MKVLLTAINAKYIHSNLAVYSLKAYAGKYSDRIELAEFTINQYEDAILQEIYRKKPDILAFSCYIWNMSLVLELVEDLRLILPETKIWLGGPEASYDGERLMREYPQIDLIMVGEGERTFLSLMDCVLEGRGCLADIPGIFWRERAERTQIAAGAEESVQTEKSQTEKPQTGKPQTEEPQEGRIHRNEKLPEPLSMDDLPFVYDTPEQFANKIIYYESSRGCPFRCSYCLSSIDKRVRFRSAELVKRELQIFLDHRVPQVKFVDRTFNCSHSHAMEIWSYILEHDNGVTNFHFEIEADLLQQEELELLGRMRPGLIQLEIGVQSVNEKTLEAVHRRTDFQKIAAVVRQIAAGGNIHQHLDLIAGLPYEDYESFAHSFDQVYRLQPQELQLGFLKVLKGSAMAEDAAGYEIRYRKRPVYEVLSTRWLSYGDLLRLKGVEEMLEVYYNSRQFSHTIAALETVFASPFALYEALADFYERTTTAGISFSRRERLELLRRFAHETDPERAQWYDQQLILDLYLRENAKTRPEWAEDLSLHREERAAFYRREEEERRYLPEYAGYTWKQMGKMTHLEHFHMPEGDCWLLFDYQKRDPLTRNASVIRIDDFILSAFAEKMH